MVDRLKKQMTGSAMVTHGRKLVQNICALCTFMVGQSITQMEWNGWILRYSITIHKPLQLCVVILYLQTYLIYYPGCLGFALWHPRTWIQKQHRKHHEAVVCQSSLRVQPERLWVPVTVMVHAERTSLDLHTKTQYTLLLLYQSLKPGVCNPASGGQNWALCCRD